MDADVLVIGAGLAGLTAARELTRSGYRVRVLEARGRVGGRTLTLEVGGERVDFGAQWVGPSQTEVLALAAELGLPTFAQYAQGRKLLDLNGRVRPYATDIPALRLRGLLSTQLAMFRLDRLARAAPLGDFAAGAAHDRRTVAGWIEANVGDQEARELLAIAVRAVFAVEPCELSLLHFLFYLRSAGGLLPLVSVRGGAQQMRLEGGAQALCERLAAQLGGAVTLGCEVRRVEQDARGVTVSARDGRRLRARRGVIALPPALARTLAWEPPLAPDRWALLERLCPGRVIKAVAVYERPFWRAAGFSGEVLASRGPLGLVYDDSPPDGRRGALVAFLLADQARRWSGKAQARREAVLAALARYFGGQAARPLAYHDLDWTLEAFSLGCYVGLTPPGVLSRYGQALRRPEGLVHFAGTETALRWNGYMDGAVESGRRVAREVACGLDGTP
ncbi:monoamine oxidase [Deinobacterium chartae]|uniref:Monoamine oxidase n=1 Tax=Deinobacterium chartae TaxID=521158 RepID=A0A841HV44_9DEIO|nr:flavin monoamine oxidase family protein [Deinobacterium chartae]MBB6097351.1 monoamine oxidase [Deinobacterium chartae]